ncbi:MAG TPA: IPT/TIG domain-containing protein, partial [Pseudomonadota bacterium]|nr:IPT/TIG domain-containing protein [Pseudomonadota bacterium]
SGGEEIVIKGRNFPTGRGGVSVLFGRHAATNVILESASAIRVTSPAGDRNTKADIVVMFDDGRAYQLKDAFQYLDATDNSKVMKHFGNKK